MRLQHSGVPLNIMATKPVVGRHGQSVKPAPNASSLSVLAFQLASMGLATIFCMAPWLLGLHTLPLFGKHVGAY
jgi:hypothetical protein